MAKQLIEIFLCVEDKHDSDIIELSSLFTVKHKKGKTTQ